MTWLEVIRSGGKLPNKVGLGYTRYKDSDLKHVTRPQKIDRETPICAIRVSKKFRVFGCRIDEVFYPLWFDKDHKIVP